LVAALRQVTTLMAALEVLAAVLVGALAVVTQVEHLHLDKVSQVAVVMVTAAVVVVALAVLVQLVQLEILALVALVHPLIHLGV
jgi:hypothetical protein